MPNPSEVRLNLGGAWFLPKSEIRGAYSSGTFMKKKRVYIRFLRKFARAISIGTTFNILTQTHPRLSKALGSLHKPEL